MNDNLRWTALAFVLGICVAYALWGGSATPATKGGPAVTPTPDLGTVAPTPMPEVVTPLVPPPFSVPKDNPTGFVPIDKIIKDKSPKPPKPTLMSSHGKTKLTVDQTELDYGDVYAGEAAKKTVKVTNTGDKPVTVMQIRHSCSCVKTNMPMLLIQPGESQPLYVYYDALRGRRTSLVNVSLETDEAGPPILGIQVKARVIEEFKIEPPVLTIGPIHKGETKTDKIRISRMDGKPFKIENLSKGRKELSYKWEAENAENKAYNVSVEATGQIAGIFQDSVAVLTDIDKTHAMILTIKLEVQNLVTSTQERVSAELSLEDDTGVFETVLKSSAPGPLIIESVTERTKLPVDYQLEKIDDSSYKFKLWFTAKFTNHAPYGEFLIKTNAEEELLSLPYRMRPRSRSVTVIPPKKSGVEAPQPETPPVITKPVEPTDPKK